MRGSVSAWLAAEALPVLRTLHLSEPALRRLARSRLRWALAAASETPLHARHFAEAGLVSRRALLEADPYDTLAALPSLRKADLREAGNTAVRNGTVLPSWLSSRSSGSTGEPFRTYFDPRAWAILKYLVKLRTRVACGLRPHHRVAVLDTVPPRERRPAPLERIGRLRVFSILQPTDTLAQALLTFSPDVLYGLPSALSAVGEELARQGAEIESRLLFTSGELASASVQSRLAELYHCPILDIYGSTETKEIAWTCLAGGLHVNADVLHLEVLDEHGRPVPPGLDGRLTVSVLVNRAMPLLRYQMGDRGRILPGRCDCGLALPLLGVVSGRESDYLTLPSGRTLSPYALTCALEEVPGLARYQIIQEGPCRLKVRAATERGADPSLVTAGIQRALASVVPEAVVEVQLVESFPTGPGGKFRVVQSAGTESVSER